MTTPTTTIDDIDTFKYMDISNWPEKISFFSTPTEQMTLPEKAMCRSVQTFLIMNKKKIIYEERANAEFMSPTNQLPFIILKDQIYAGWDEIVELFVTRDENSNLNDIADVYIFTKLYDLEQYTSWCSDNNFDRIKLIYSKLYPFPLNKILCYRKKYEIVNKLKYKLENKINIGTVYDEIKNVLEYFDSHLKLNKELVDRKSNKFNALLYGHIYALLNTDLFSDELKDIVKSCKNLLSFYDEIENRYYKNS